VSGLPLLPGGVGVSHLKVYDTVAPDGLAGGTPHLHTACTEAYAVVRGHGRVQTLSADGYREVRLGPGTLAWFTPGTVHRLVNDSGDLELYVIMQNSGLPEAGDLVITFPDDVLADPAAYRAAATLPPGETTTDGTGAAARARRDHGVRGFGEWRLGVEEGGPPVLARLHRRAAALVGGEVGEWRRLWEAGAQRAAATTGAHLDELEAGDAALLASATVHCRETPVVPGEPRLMGCCGTLGTFVTAEEIR